jgi:glycerate dehydrogenase
VKSVFLDLDSVGHDVDIARLRKQLPRLRIHSDTEPGQIDERIIDAEIVIINKVRLNEPVLRAAKKLRLVCLAATGTDNVDLDSARELGIAVCNIRDYCTPSVVQHVFALILTLNQRLLPYRVLLRTGAWSRSNQFCLLDFPFRELAGRTLGVVGMGALGGGVAAVASAFGMEVIAARRGDTAEDTGGVRRVPLDELLGDAHIISLHCPLTAETGNMIDAQALGRMRNDALLINTARGGLVDSKALIAALQSGQIAGAGIDVLPTEPPVHSDPLLDVDLPNLIVTPHIAWAARESRQRAIDEIAANVGAFLHGDRRNRIV